MPLPPPRRNHAFADFLVLFLAAIGLLALPSCSTAPKQIVPVGQPPNEKVFETIRTERGIASYYYGRWIGRKTASGEIYRATDVTAAHKTLPFGTLVRVTNLRNGKSVIVRINNRGPYVKGRILDLSLEAARRIEMTAAGIIPVKMEVLREIPTLEKPNLRRPKPTPGPASISAPNIQNPPQKPKL